VGRIQAVSAIGRANVRDWRKKPEGL